jgi:hypothetical protein
MDSISTRLSVFPFRNTALGHCTVQAVRPVIKSDMTGV